MNAALRSLSSLRETVASKRSSTIPAPSLATRLDSLAREGFAAFEEQGIPTRRLEQWKGTNLAPLEAMDFTRVGPAASAPDLRAEETSAFHLEEASADLEFVDGRLRSPSSSRATLPDGIRVLSLVEAAVDAPELVEAHLGAIPDLKKESLVALNTALFEDVAVVHLESRARASRPIRIRALATADGPKAASASFPRLLVVAERDSEATIFFESGCAGEAPGLSVFVAEYRLAAGARIETVQVQAEGPDRIHVTSSHARLEANARFESHVFSLGTGLVRSELSVTLDEPGAETRMRGFFLGREQGHVDHFTTVDHAAAHCTSDEEYRGVLGDEADGVFRGRVIIRAGAQQSDARQSNPNLLLSDRASIDTKPQLEIYADDVRASHGATIGQLDEDALFFLRARGIDEAEARLVLTRGFAFSIVDGIENESVRTHVGERVETALAALHPTGTSIATDPAQDGDDRGRSA